MTPMKLEQLFNAARQERPPVPRPGFSSRVVENLRGEAKAAPPDLLEHLAELFPRVAWAAVLVLALCILAEFWFSTQGQPDLTSSFVELSEQWAFANNEL
jgi:hypothetical protein